METELNMKILVKSYKKKLQYYYSWAKKAECNIYANRKTMTQAYEFSYSGRTITLLVANATAEMKSDIGKPKPLP